MNQSSLSPKSGLTKKNLMGYALGDLGGCMTFAILGSFLTPYYTEVAGLSTGAVAAMYLVLKIWDAINDPMMGTIMDKIFAKTHSPKGKFRPWMLRSAPLLFISSILMYTAPTYTNGAAKLVVAFVTYLIYEASYTMFNIPYGSLLSSMANTDGERASLSSARGFGGLIGNLLPLIAFPLIIDNMTANPQLGYTAGITVCAGIGLISCLFSCKFTCERNLKPVTEDMKDSSEVKFSDIFVVFKQNRAFTALCIVGVSFCIMQYINTTLGIYMFRDVLGSLSMMSLAMVVGMPLSFLALLVLPKLATKFGLEKTVRSCLLIATALFVILFFLPSNALVYMIGQSLAMGFASVTVLMQWGMIGEAIDYNELLTGKRTEGSIYGTFNLTRRVGQAIGSSAAVALLGVIGYVPNAATQTAGVQMGIRFLVILLPAVFTLICWASFKYVWNITPELRAQIAAFKNPETAEISQDAGSVEK